MGLLSWGHAVQLLYASTIVPHDGAMGQGAQLPPIQQLLWLASSIYFDLQVGRHTGSIGETVPASLSIIGGTRMLSVQVVP